PRTCMGEIVRSSSAVMLRNDLAAENVKECANRFDQRRTDQSITAPRPIFVAQPTSCCSILRRRLNHSGRPPSYVMFASASSNSPPDRPERASKEVTNQKRPNHHHKELYRKHVRPAVVPRPKA